MRNDKAGVGPGVNPENRRKGDIAILATRILLVTALVAEILGPLGLLVRPSPNAYEISQFLPIYYSLLALVTVAPIPYLLKADTRNRPGPKNPKTALLTAQVMAYAAAAAPAKLITELIIH